MFLMAVVTISGFVGLIKVKGCTVYEVYKENTQVRASAQLASRIDVSPHWQVPLPLQCISKCNDETLCTAFQISTNATCDLILSTVQHVTIDDTFTLYRNTKFSFKCPQGFDYIFNTGTLTPNGNDLPSCYHFFLDGMNWGLSRDHCRSLGADLISLETAEEQLHIQNIIESVSNLRLTEIPGGGYWTSGSDADDEGKWIWKATGGPLTYRNWMLFNPDNHQGTQNYLRFGISGKYTWDDYWYGGYLAALCEIIAVF